MRIAVLPLALFLSCGGSASSLDVAGNQDVVSSRGQLLLSMSATTRGPLPREDLEKIVLHVEEVRIKGDRGWKTVATGPFEVDLLALQDSELELAWTELEAEHFNQLRLVLVDGAEHYVTLANGEQHDLKVPSGEQSGLKIKGDFKITPCYLTSFDIDVDVPRSLHVHGPGHGRNFMLRPVVRGSAQLTELDECDETLPPGEQPQPETPGEDPEGPGLEPDPPGSGNDGTPQDGEPGQNEPPEGSEGGSEGGTDPGPGSDPGTDPGTGGDNGGIPDL